MIQDSDIIGKSFYRWTIRDDETKLDEFSITGTLLSSQDDKRRYSITDENFHGNYVVYYVNESKFYLSDGRKETLIFRTVNDATEYIWNRQESERQLRRNISLYTKKIINSKPFQDVLENNPHIMI